MFGGLLVETNNKDHLHGQSHMHRLPCDIDQVTFDTRNYVTGWSTHFIM